MNISELAHAYLTHLDRRVKRGLLSADHVANNRRDVTNFLKFIGSKTLDDCKQHDLTKWLNANPTWIKVATRRRAVGAVIAMFNWGLDEELIDRNPYRSPKSLREEHVEPRRPATKEEYLALLRAGTPELKRGLFFLYRTGVRTCEMYNLVWDEVILGDLPHLNLANHKTRRKTGQAKLIALDPAVAKFLAHLLRTAKSKYVFLNCEGGKWDRHTFARHLRRTAERIGLDVDKTDRVSAYCLRHTWACDALEAGLTTKQVADHFGHTDTTMVERVYGSHTSRNLAYLSANAALLSERRSKV